jgi:hypothetical protein
MARQEVEEAGINKRTSLQYHNINIRRKIWFIAQTLILLFKKPSALILSKIS